MKSIAGTAPRNATIVVNAKSQDYFSWGIQGLLYDEFDRKDLRIVQEDVLTGTAPNGSTLPQIAKDDEVLVLAVGRFSEFKPLNVEKYESALGRTLKPSQEIRHGAVRLANFRLPDITAWLVNFSKPGIFSHTNVTISCFVFHAV